MRFLGSASPSDVARGKWTLFSKYDKQLVELCKSTPGLKWNGEGRVWTGYRDAMVTLALRAAAFDIEVKVKGYVRPAVTDWSGPLFEGLRPYQKKAATFLIQMGREGCILGDVMGLGKTRSALTAAGKVSRLLVVCPSYVRDVWVREIAKWTSRGAPFLPEGVTKKKAGIPEGCTTIVIHYDILHAWAPELSLWLDGARPGDSGVCFDEAHMLQNESSKRAIAAREVALSSDYKWALTGTPMTNRPRDLWNVVDVVSPGRLGGFFSFGLRYCDAHQENVTPEKVVWVFKGQSNLEELRTRVGEFMLRRTVQDVGLELPPKTRQVLYLDAGRAATKAIPEGRSGPAMRRSLDVVADAKMPAVWDLLKGHLEGGLKVVCFTWRREVAESLADKAREAGFSSECVHGGISHQRRGLAIERAKNAEGGVLVATIDSASVGVDFTFASVCLFAEIDYKPHALLQAEARVHRFGASQPVLIQYALGKGTIDEAIAGVVIEKLDTFAAAIGGTGETVAEDLRGNSDDVMAELMGAIEAGKK